MYTTHALVARAAALEAALERILSAMEGYHPDGLPEDVEDALLDARKALDDQA